MNAEQLKPKAIKASERFLESRGYEILETGWECAAGGADIIARDEAAVVFVEVNARTGVGAGFPAEAGTEAKRAKFERTAIAYMSGYEETDVSVRFDIISSAPARPSPAPRGAARAPAPRPGLRCRPPNRYGPQRTR